MFSGIYGEGVIESRLRPGKMRGIVTEFTICGKTRRLVVWILGRIIILLVTVHTFIGRILIMHMAPGTIKISVSSLQRKVLVVGNICVFPVHCICSVTDLAVSVEAQLFVIRIFSIEIILQMAEDTYRG
jgi:hypothetical protein